MNQKCKIPPQLYYNPNLISIVSYYMYGGNTYILVGQPQMQLPKRETTKVEVKVEEALQKNQQIDVKAEESSSSSSQTPIQACKKSICKGYHIFAGETKNYYKNVGQKLANFIYEEFKNVPIVQEDSHVKAFLKIESQNFNRLSIAKLLKSDVGRRIARQFFANYKWAQPFLQQHKTELDLYFRHNCQLYTKKKDQTKQKLSFGTLQVKVEQD